MFSPKLLISKRVLFVKLKFGAHSNYVLLVAFHAWFEIFILSLEQDISVQSKSAVTVSLVKVQEVQDNFSSKHATIEKVYRKINLVQLLNAFQLVIFLCKIMVNMFSFLEKNTWVII